MCIRDRRSTVGTAGRLAVVVETRYNVTTLSRRNLGAVTWYRRWSGRRRSGHARAGIPSSATGTPPAAAPGPRRGRRVRRGLGERGPDDAWRPCSIGIRTSLRCGWRAFRRVTVVTVDRWNSGTAGRYSGDSLQRYNVVTS